MGKKQRNQKNQKWGLAVRPSLDSKELSRRLKKAESKGVSHAHKFIVRRWTSVGDARRQITLWFMLVGFLIILVGVQLLLYRNSYTTTAPANDSVYVEGVLGPVTTMNPLFASTSAEQALSKLIFSQPMSYDTSGVLGYDALDDLTIDESETVYKMALREDIEWQDGIPMTAKDLVFTINLLKNPEVKAGTSSVWEGVEVKEVGEFNVELKLNSPYAPFVNYLNFPILPEHLLKEVPASELKDSPFSEEPVGSGPFTFKFIQDGDTVGGSQQAVHLARNDNYYRGKPRISRFQLLVYDTPESLLAALNNKEVNGMADILPSQLAKVDATKYNVRAVPTQGGVYLLFNTQAESLKEVKLRQALRFALDTNELQKRVGNGQLEEMYLPTFVDPANLEKPKHDPALAKAYLDELGWKQQDDGSWKKGEEELRFKLAVIKSAELEVAADEVIRQLNGFGIKTDLQILDLDSLEQGAVQNTLQPRDFDMLVNKINIGADSDVYAYWHSSQASKNGLNFSNYKNEIADDALSTARNKRDPALRSAKYSRFASRWLEDAPAVGLYRTSANYVNLPSTRSFSDEVKFVSPISRYSDLLYWTTGTRSVYKTP